MASEYDVKFVVRDHSRPKFNSITHIGGQLGSGDRWEISINEAIEGIIDKVTLYVRAVDLAITSNQGFASALTADVILTITATLKIIGLFIGALVAMRIALFIGRTALMMFNGALLLSKGTMAALTIATKLFNAALRLSPLGTVLTLIGLLIAAATVLITNWDKVKAFFLDLWETVAEVMSVLTQPFKDMASGIGGIMSKISGAVFNFFDDDDEKDTSANPQIISPQERIARIIEERNEQSKAEVTIKTEDGVQAELTGGKLGPGLTLLQTGSP